MDALHGFLILESPIENVRTFRQLHIDAFMGARMRECENARTSFASMTSQPKPAKQTDEFLRVESQLKKRHTT